MTASGTDLVRAEPCGALEIDLAALWPRRAPGPTSEGDATTKD